MPTLGKLTVKNLVYYDHAEIDLGYEGVTYLSGRNLSSTLKGRNNGSGKSLLISPVANLLKSVLPSHEKNARALKHSMFRTGTEVSLQLGVGERVYHINKAMPKSSIKWDILEDGTPMNHPTATKAEDFVASLCPLNEQEFFSTVYLDSRRPNTMHVGTASERFNYFSDLFRLHDYDNIKKYFSTRIKELEEARIKRDVLTEQMAKYSYTETFEYRSKKKELADVKEQLTALDSECAAIAEKISSLGMYVLNQKAYESANVNIDEIKSEVVALEKLIKAATQWENYDSQKRKVDERISVLKKKLLKIEGITKSDFKVSAKDLKKLISTNQKLASTLTSSIESLDETCEQLKEDLDEVVTALTKVSRITKKLGKLKKTKSPDYYQSKIEANQEHQTAIEDFLGGNSTSTCSVCGAAFTKKDAKTKLAALAKKAEVLVAQLEQAEDYYNVESQLADYPPIKKLKSDKEKLSNKLAEAKKKLKQAKAKLSGLPDLEAATELYELYSSTSTAIKEVQTVEKPKGKRPTKSLDKLNANLKVLNKQLNTILTLKPMVKHIVKGLKIWESSSAKSPKHLLDTLKKEEEKLAKKKSSLHTKVEDLSLELREYKRDKAEWDSLVKQRNKISKGLDDLDIFDALVEAYGAKGLKVLASKRIATIIQNNMNKYSSLLFPERFEFKIDVDINVFDIIVERHSKGEKKVSDVRHLSGSESRSFCLLWLISILPLIPAERRYNLVILDEFESNMDHVTREMVCKDFIPILNTIVPHIIFISPYADIPIDAKNVRYLVVEKGVDGVSRLKQREGLAA